MDAERGELLGKLKSSADSAGYVLFDAPDLESLDALDRRVAEDVHLRGGERVSGTLVETVRSELVRPVRHEVLRPNQPMRACVYPNDDESHTKHYAIVIDGNAVAVASIFREPPPKGWNNRAYDAHWWRIRGMATRPAVRRQGHGMSLLKACLQYAETKRGVGVWCNARTSVRSFYEKGGFRAVGEEFELPPIGPHLLMVHQPLSVRGEGA